MDISAVVGILALTVAVYALYRALTVSSDVRLAAHDAVHDEIVDALAVCGVHSQFFMERVSDHGYVMSEEGFYSTQQEKEAFVSELKAIDQRITDQLLIDRLDLWRFRIAARVQVASRNNMWRDSRSRVRRMIFVISPQRTMIDTNR